MSNPLAGGFTTSLPSALSVMFGYSPRFVLVGQIIGGLGLVAALVTARKGLLGTPATVFAALATMAVVTPGLGDYHLLPFLLPLLLLARENRMPAPADWVVIGASMLVLVPKNYFYGRISHEDPWSWQVVANPLVLLAALVAVLVLAWRSAPAARAARA